MDEQNTPKQGESPSNAWMLTFADLISLLITFFVMLYAMKVVDSEKWEDIKGALSGALKFTDQVMRFTPTEKKQVDQIVLREADNLDYLQTLLQTQFAFDPVLKTAEMVRDLDLETLTIVLPNHLLFSSGSAEIIAEGRTAILRMGEVLRNLGNQMEVAGHTDPVPVASAAYPSNWELSMMRALSVTQLLHTSGVTEPIISRGYGESRYNNIDPTLPQAERLQKARRVEVIIKLKSE
jgi:chemotaxis protein MotB